MTSKILNKRNIVLASTVYLLFFVGYGFIVFYIFRDQKFELTQGGLFGDMFGAINAFFTGLAFLAVALSIFLQLRESEDTKNSQRRYQFENTFFNLLSVLHQVIDSSRQHMARGGETITIEGRRYFRYVFSNFEERYKEKVLPTANRLFEEFRKNEYSKGASPEQVAERYSANVEVLLPLLKSTYEQFYRDNDANLGHYFRFVFNIVKFIRESFSEETDMQERYIGLIQAQMSNDEMGLLFYNCLSIHGMNTAGEPQFRDWLDEYNFFENIDGRCVFDQSYTRLYPRTKFKFLRQQNIS